MKRSMCGLHCLVPEQLVQGQGQSPYMHCGAARGGPYRFSITILFVNAQHTVEALA